MSQGAFHAAHPALVLVVQVGSSSSHFTTGVHPYPISRANNPHHLSFGQNFAASHARSLGYMLYTLNRFLSHLQNTRRDPPKLRERDELLPVISSIFAAALVDLASHNFAQALIELELNGFLLGFLAFLLVAVGFFFRGSCILEDFGLHLE